MEPLDRYLKLGIEVGDRDTGFGLGLTHAGLGLGLQDGYQASDKTAVSKIRVTKIREKASVHSTTAP